MLKSTTTNAFVADLRLVPTISVSPTSLPFGTQLVGATTAPMLVTLTNNTGSAITLTIPATITGTNPADFAESAGTCTTSLAAGGDLHDRRNVHASRGSSIFRHAKNCLHLQRHHDQSSDPAHRNRQHHRRGNHLQPHQPHVPWPASHHDECRNAGDGQEHGHATSLSISKVATGTSAFTETDNCAGTTVAPAGPAPSWSRSHRNRPQRPEQ